MNSFKVEGGVRLSGEVFPQGAKNEALQVICSVILTEKEYQELIKSDPEYTLITEENFEKIKKKN